VKVPKTYFEKIPLATMKRILTRQGKLTDFSEQRITSRPRQNKNGRPTLPFSGRKVQSWTLRTSLIICELLLRPGQHICVDLSSRQTLPEHSKTALPASMVHPPSTIGGN